MDRRDSVWRLPGGAGRGPLCVLGALLLGLAGCMHDQQQARLQSDDEGEHYEIRTVGDVTSVANPQPTPLGGVGLVVGLEGTGGEPAPGNYRTMLEDVLRKQGVHNVKE